MSGRDWAMLALGAAGTLLILASVICAAIAHALGAFDKWAGRRKP